MDLISALEQDFAHWDSLYKNGGQDPFWADGANLNLVRARIIGRKQEIVEECPLLAGMGICSREIPPVVPDDYMARPDEIRDNAKKRRNSLPQTQILLGCATIATNLTHGSAAKLALTMLSAIRRRWQTLLSMMTLWQCVALNIPTVICNPLPTQYSVYLRLTAAKLRARTLMMRTKILRWKSRCGSEKRTV